MIKSFLSPSSGFRHSFSFRCVNDCRCCIPGILDVMMAYVQKGEGLARLEMVAKKRDGVRDGSQPACRYVEEPMCRRIRNVNEGNEGGGRAVLAHLAISSCCRLTLMTVRERKCPA